MPNKSNTPRQNQDHKKQEDHTDQRGFASMDPERQREIAAEGGRAAHEKGTTHEFTSEEAREAGAKGGKASHASGNNQQGHEFDSKEAREAGAKGGRESHKK